ncbi:MAG: CDP-diacylglycerol---glycerol-3-phosphate 3-phosphatidyltransferase [Actinomycetota bacterium]|jgi:CDP-diacylglycerol--glycerol-3-phosphate 3-phosphatidyltransferase|nr:CDP-diacylglycerol---glycerol-3-phosphate 3-phosphatidyltransferase [Actinomycetota bacterium]
MFDGRWRKGVETGVNPVASAIRRTGLTADHLTATGLIIAVVDAVAIATGHLFLGFVLLVLAAVPDLLDGAVAKLSGTASPRGAFFDSVSDRITDSLVLGAIAWYLVEARGGHAAILPLAVLGTSSLISYQRAKAESLGYVAKGGLMERAERIIALCLALVFSALMIPVLWVMLVLTSITAVQRFAKVWRQASAPRPAKEDSRWRVWRESSLLRTGVERDRRRSPSRERWSARRREAMAGRSWRRHDGTRRP